MIITWLRGLLATRAGRLAGIAAGIAIAVALLADIGLFIEAGAQSMTARVLAGSTVDWQVELLPGADEGAVRTAIAAAMSATTIEAVDYAGVAGLEFVTADGTQLTGTGVVAGLPPGYLESRHDSFRLLAGTTEGAVLLQQTAANLHAVPGDTIVVHRIGGSDAVVAISGIIDLKTADTFFQVVGVPPGAAPQAPPDNAVLMPRADWQALFAAGQPQEQARTQLHVRLDHAVLATDPGAAYLEASRAGHNLEVRVAGAALLSNTLAAQLDAARGDALYARVLFLFLGAPGVILAGLLTVALAASGGERRRRDQSLLRLRGAPMATLLGLAAVEAAAIGTAGVAAGLGVAVIAAGLLGLEASAPWWLGWSAIAGSVGLGLAVVAVLLPSWLSARRLSVAELRRTMGTERQPLWERLYIDLLCLALAAVVFWQTAASGYQVVLATEGVTAIAVDYAAFLSPVLVWIGAGLAVLRLVRLGLRHGRGVVAAVMAPLAGTLAPAVASSMSVQRRRLSAGAAFVALAVAFATSTAIFNTTYQGQARIDALLTNGADVTVSGSSAAPAGAQIDRLAAIPGVAAAAAMQHRFAYVGTDLQDLYGIDIATLVHATTLANAYFANGSTTQTLATLAATPDAALVSEETVTDFQLTPGDRINLRLQGSDGQYRAIPFTFAGVVREFPTAPRDSFIVANADYVATATGIAAREVVLLRTADPVVVAAQASEVVSALPGVTVSEIGEARHVIGSSLTAVGLDGLTRLELAFAVLLAIAAAGVVTALGLADRRRSFAILTALGARRRQLAAFIAAEAVLPVVAGTLAGGIIGWLVAHILVVVLQGVFDPPPETLSVPLPYLITVAAVIAASAIAALANAIFQSGVEPLRRLRELQ